MLLGVEYSCLTQVRHKVSALAIDNNIPWFYPKMESSSVRPKVTSISDYVHHMTLPDLNILSNMYTFCRLADNEFCQSPDLNSPYCNVQENLGSSFSTTANCSRLPQCTSEQISSPNCICAYPFTGTYIFRAPSALGNSDYFTTLQDHLLNTLRSYALPVDSVSLSNISVDVFNNRQMQLAVFPAGQDHFNRTGIIGLSFVLSNQTYKPPDAYGPYVFSANFYPYFDG